MIRKYTFQFFLIFYFNDINSQQSPKPIDTYSEYIINASVYKYITE